MGVSVRSKFMTGISDTLDERRMSLGDPSQDEKRGSYLGLAEKLKETIRVPDNPTLQRFPTRPRDAVLEGRDVEVVLYVDRHGVDN
jgi:hypothetical protein